MPSEKWLTDEMKIGHVHDYKSDDVAQWQSTRKRGRRFESAHRPQSNSTNMEKKTIDMNLSIVDAFKKRFPDLDIKDPTDRKSTRLNSSHWS